jgi:hypothetical protein
VRSGDIARKAKEAMYKWIMTVEIESQAKHEVVAWQAGYIAGLNSSEK